MRGVVIVAVSFFSILCGNTFAQTWYADTIVFKTQNKAVSFFNKSVGAQTEIFNGVVYTLYPSGSRGTFYFKDKNYVLPAQLLYNGTIYKDVPVIYDVYHDQMVSFANGVLFVLVPENLSNILLDGHYFVRATAGSSTAYYEELYNGSSQVLVKHIKLVEEHIIPPQTAENWYVDKKQLYIRSNEKYITITGKTALLKAFGNKRKEVERYLADNKLDYNTDPENTVVKAAIYFDHLNK